MESFARVCGYAVYAVAFSDRKFESAEKVAIHQFLEDNWVKIADNSDPFAVKSIEFIEQMVEALTSEKLDTEVAFVRFKNYYAMLSTSLETSHKQFLIDLCIKVGNAFNRMNKAELIMLSRIEGVIKING